MTVAPHDASGYGGGGGISGARPLPRRHYREVGIDARGDGFAILLDDKTVRTPADNVLLVPAAALAVAIAGEWSAQGARIDPASMVLSRIANTALDRVRGRQGDIIAEILQYAGNDLLCYRADTHEDLQAREAVGWDPVLDWAEATLGAKFQVVRGVMHVAQPEGAIAAVRLALQGEGPFALAALHNMTTLTGSALLVLAVVRGRLSDDEAWAAAHVDEDFQAEKWGRDEAAEARRQHRWREMQIVSHFYTLLHTT